LRSVRRADRAASCDAARRPPGSRRRRHRARATASTAGAGRAEVQEQRGLIGGGQGDEEILGVLAREDAQTVAALVEIQQRPRVAELVGRQRVVVPASGCVVAGIGPVFDSSMSSRHRSRRCASRRPRGSRPRPCSPPRAATARSRGQLDGPVHDELGHRFIGPVSAALGGSLPSRDIEHTLPNHTRFVQRTSVRSARPASAVDVAGRTADRRPRRPCQVLPHEGIEWPHRRGLLECRDRPLALEATPRASTAARIEITHTRR